MPQCSKCGREISDYGLCSRCSTLARKIAKSKSQVSVTSQHTSTARRVSEQKLAQVKAEKQQEAASQPGSTASQKATHKCKTVCPVCGEKYCLSVGFNKFRCCSCDAVFITEETDE